MFFKQIPNMLSLIRILLVPVIFNNYLAATSSLDYLLCGLLLVISGITDMADGVMARKFNLTSKLGGILDPVADKLTQIMVAIALFIRHSWMWPLLGILVLKDVIITISGLYLYKKYRYLGTAKWYGKVATFVFYAVVILLVSIPDALTLQRLSGAVYLVIVAMLFSGVMYGLQTWIYIRKTTKEQLEAKPQPLEIDEEKNEQVVIK